MYIGIIQVLVEEAKRGGKTNLNWCCSWEVYTIIMLTLSPLMLTTYVVPAIIMVGIKVFGLGQ